MGHLGLLRFAKVLYRHKRISTTEIVLRRAANAPQTYLMVEGDFGEQEFGVNVHQLAVTVVQVALSGENTQPLVNRRMSEPTPVTGSPGTKS